VLPQIMQVVEQLLLVNSNVVLVVALIMEALQH
jgi:hypothetical protein